MVRTHGKGIIYSTKDDGSVTYEIPLKTLADRFMPKAVLLSSWYMLKQNESVPEGEEITVDIVMQQIRDIYDKACLEGEDVPEKNWLLVKNVKASTGNYDVPEVITDSVFTMPNIEGKTSLSKYLMKGSSALRNQATDLIYSNYSTNYDCRGVSTPNAGGSAGTTTTTSQSIQESLLTPIKQSFGGTLEEDLINDLELILNHYMDDKNIQLTNSQYKKIIEDFTKQINGIDESSIQSLGSSNKYKEYIIYQIDRNGEYVIDCEKMNEDTPVHHSTGNTGTTHEQKYGHEEFSSGCDSKIASEHKDPYAAGAHVDCFIPYIRVAVSFKKADRTYEDGTTETVRLKSTAAIIIQNEDIGDLYRVDEKEIDDIAGLTNKVSFMKFARGIVKIDNLKEWNLENGDSNLKDRVFFVVEDLFEARPLKLTGITSGVDVYKKGGVGDVHVYNSSGKHIGSGISKIVSLMGDFEIDSSTITSALESSGIESYPAGKLGIVRPSISSTRGDYDTIPTSNAAPDDANGYDPAWGIAGPGESVILSDTYINITKSEDKINNFLAELNKKLSVDNKIRSFINKYSIWITHDIDGDVYIDSVALFKKYFSCSAPSLTEGDVLGDYVALFTVEKKVTTIDQPVKERAVTLYMPTEATTWSNHITMSNTEKKNGEFDPECSSEKGGYFQLVPKSKASKGMQDFEVGTNKQWRTGFYAQYFSKVREADVLAMVSEWEEAANDGVFAANTYIRDLYSLIYYSKENAEETGSEFDALRDSDGKPYVDKKSYTYFYIPEEILGFDETVTDKAFWMERLLATNSPDQIKPEENLVMKTARNVKTWQVVDYSLYPECQVLDSDGKVIEKEGYVYALWLFGGYLGRSLYAFEANASEKANHKVLSWGWYTGPNGHAGCDMYGRGNATRIYRVNHSGTTPFITAEYNNATGMITMSSLAGGSVTIDGNGQSTLESGVDDENLLAASSHGSISTASAEGAYISGPVTIDMEGTEVTFSGPAAAVYGYELYRLTKAYKDGDKAQKILDEQLAKEELDNPVVAIAPGIVKVVKAASGAGFGVHIWHKDGTYSTYAHMKRWPEVQVGEYVGAGTILGYEGTTGNSNGYHTHIEIHRLSGDDGTGALYPMQFFYPFFTPFYYQEKVDEMKQSKGTDKILESEYLSLQRTVYPVGQANIMNGADMSYSFGDQEGSLNQVENDEKGKIVTKNYVPTKPLCLYSELYKSDSPDVTDYTKLPENKTVLGAISYSGETVKALPQYFDKGFIDLVLKNGGHILIDPDNAPNSPIGRVISTPQGGKVVNNSPNTTDGTGTTTDTVNVSALVPDTYSSSDFGMDKPVLSKENNYTDEEWKAMEKVLAERVQKAGFGTRAGVVEAALFLASLDYAVPYRGTPMDASHDIGHYNRIGLNTTWGDYVALSKDISRTTAAKGTVTYKKGTKVLNGLDCAAFIEWVCKNGGDIKSYGVSPNKYGSGGVQNITKVADKIQPGDFAFTSGIMWNGEKGYTHIGIVVGVDEKNIYVAEELTTSYNKLTVTTVPKDGSYSRLSNIVLADGKFYPEEANGKNNIGNMTYVWGGGSAE